MTRGVGRFIEGASRAGLIVAPVGLLMLLGALVVAPMLPGLVGPFGVWSEMRLRAFMLSMLACVLGGAVMAAAGGLSRRAGTTAAVLVASAAGTTGVLWAVAAMIVAHPHADAWKLLLRIAFAAGVVGAAVAAITGLDAVKVPAGAASRLRSIVRILVGCWAVAALGLCVLVGADRALRQHRDTVELLTVACIAILLLCTVASAGLTATLLRLARRRAAPAESIAAKVAIELACPRCETEQTLGTGYVRCGACGFAMRIEVEEPRCECGYLLFRIEGDQCPECGAALPRPEASRKTT